jgi:hypothetical protein
MLPDSTVSLAVMTGPAGASLPRFARYLASLPGGLQAHPEAMVKGSHLRLLLDGDHRASLVAAVPEPLRTLVLNPPMPNDWVSEAHFGAVIHAVADVRGMSDADVVRWSRERNQALMSTPLYRMVMKAFSPAALLRRGAERWNVGHCGSSLEVLSVSRNEARWELRFPVRLFDELLLRMYAEAFAVVIEGTRARDPAITLESADDTSARYLGRWQMPHFGSFGRKTEL